MKIQNGRKSGGGDCARKVFGISAQNFKNDRRKYINAFRDSEKDRHSFESRQYVSSRDEKQGARGVFERESEKGSTLPVDRVG